MKLETDTAKTLDRFPSEEEIAKFKLQHGEIFDLTTKHKGKEYILVIRKPTIRDIERADASKKSSGKTYDWHKSILNNCKLAITEAGMSTDEVLMGWARAIDDTMDIAEVTVKKL